jgi:hypothetical protein
MSLNTLSPQARAVKKPTAPTRSPAFISVRKPWEHEPIDNASSDIEKML